MSLGYSKEEKEGQRLLCDGPEGEGWEVRSGCQQQAPVCPDREFGSLSKHKRRPLESFKQGKDMIRLF